MNVRAPQTSRQREALAYIDGFIQQAGYSPTLDQIAASLGLQAKSGACRVVDELEAQGFLRRTGTQRCRVLEVISRVPDSSDLRRLADDDLTTLSTRVTMEKARRGMS